MNLPRKILVLNLLLQIGKRNFLKSFSVLKVTKSVDLVNLYSVAGFYNTWIRIRVNKHSCYHLNYSSLSQLLSKK